MRLSSEVFSAAGKIGQITGKDIQFLKNVRYDYEKKTYVIEVEGTQREMNE